MMPRSTLPRALLLAFALPALAAAQVTFSFNYTDSAGNGFYDPTLGATRRGALESVGATLAGYFAGHPARTVTFDVSSYTGNANGTLAAAGADYDTPNNSFQRGYVQDKIINNLDNGSAAEGVLIWNFTYSWDYDDAVAGGSYDFKAVALHEMTHTLGFASLIGSNGAGAGAGTTYSFFDQFLTDASGNRLVSTGATYAGGAILSNGVGGDVFFSGPNAMAAFGGRVPIYSPATFQEGSSLSHLDTDYFSSAAYLMEHAVSTGPAPRTLSTLELAVLADLGYTMTAVPEPAALALVAGVLALGGALRRRRAT